MECFDYIEKDVDRIGAGRELFAEPFMVERGAPLPCDAEKRSPEPAGEIARPLENLEDVNPKIGPVGLRQNLENRGEDREPGRTRR